MSAIPHPAIARWTMPKFPLNSTMRATAVLLSISSQCFGIQSRSSMRKMQGPFTRDRYLYDFQILFGFSDPLPLVIFRNQLNLLPLSAYWGHGCQMAKAIFLDRMCLALRASGLWLRYATLQNLIPSFPWIAPPRPPPCHNPRKGRDQILPSGNLGRRPDRRKTALERETFGRGADKWAKRVSPEPFSEEGFIS